MKIEKCSKSIKKRKQFPVDSKKLEETISYKKHLLANALKIPPAINQFKTCLNEEDTEKVFNALKSYKPENKREKAERIKRLAENNGVHQGPKPNIIKFGIKHVVDLIERKITKLVVIAADVDPIEVVIYLPTLCRKMGIPYMIVSSKKHLGALVNLKSTAVIALNGWDAKDEVKMKEIVDLALQNYNNCYETAMNVWGGGVLLAKQVEATEEINN